MSSPDAFSKNDGSEMQGVPVQGVPLAPNTTTVIVERDEAAATYSNKMMVASASLCVVSLLLIIAAQYYLYLYVFYDETSHSGADEASTVLFSIASVAAVVAAILGSIYIRDLPEESRKMCRIGIAVVGGVFFVAIAVLFAIWVAPRDRDPAPSDYDDGINLHGLTILVGSLIQIAVFVCVCICLCVAFCVASCCGPPHTVEHRVHH